MKKITFFSATLILLASCGSDKAADAGGDSTATSSSTAPAPDLAPAPAAKTIIFTCSMNGVEWQAGPMSVSEMYFAKGSKMLKKPDPFLTLVFVSAVEGDSRQILIYVDNWTPKTGVVPISAIDLTLSGVGNDAAKTNYFGNNSSMGKKIPVNLEITKWEAGENGQAIVSGKLSADIPGVMGAAGGKIENGVFTDVKINVDQTGM